MFVYVCVCRVVCCACVLKWLCVCVFRVCAVYVLRVCGMCVLCVVCCGVLLCVVVCCVGAGVGVQSVVCVSFLSLSPSQSYLRLHHRPALVSKCLQVSKLLYSPFSCFDLAHQLASVSKCLHGNSQQIVVATAAAELDNDS